MRATPSIQVALKLARVVGATLDDFDGGPPNELFHYTDTNGLIGVLREKGELWATDLRCMNDTDELTLGKKLLEDAIEARTDHPARSLLTELLVHPAYVSPLIFVVSFSTQRDLLSQWRAYAADGSGFVLGFLSEKLKRNLRFDGKDPLMHLVRVEYDRGAQERRARQIAQQALDTLMPLAEGNEARRTGQAILRPREWPNRSIGRSI
jgi:hypothetical protein